MAQRTINIKKQLPRILEPVSRDEFIRSIQAVIERGGQPQLLLFTCDVGQTVATRNVASNHVTMCKTKLPIHFPMPQKGTETYITSETGYLTGIGGEPHSESKGMIDDWYGNRRAMNCLLNDTTAQHILQQAFGIDYRLLPERGYYRNMSDLSKDMKLTSDQLVVHKDHPQWIRSKTAQVEIVTAKCTNDELAWILIDQAEYHGLPKGGQCIGWFVSAVTPTDGFQTYLNRVEHHLKRLRLGQLKSINHDPLGQQYVPVLSPLDCLLLDFVKGSRPYLYESGKVIQGPHSMTANRFPYRQHHYLTQQGFTTIRSNGTNTFNVDTIENMMQRLKERGLFYAFEPIASITTEWNVDPTTFSDEALLRFFNLVPQLKGKEVKEEEQGDMDDVVQVKKPLKRRKS